MKKKRTRLEDLLKKEVALFIYRNGLKPTEEEVELITLAMCRGAQWAVGEVKNNFDNIERRIE